MPIYAYRCADCGHTKDVLQKVSDAALTTCPSCGKDAFKKQLTAAGFQLKGTGWYVTDFRNNGSGGTSKPAVGDKSEAASPAPASSTDSTAAPSTASTAS
ncbi:MAG TPA: FmdB family zinc ribbon protein [Noviherbaspirillum sp.]